MRCSLHRLRIGTLLIVAVVSQGCSKSEQRDPREIMDEVVRLPTERKVMLLALDGLCSQIMDPLLEAGELPHLARLIDNGASGPLTTTKPCFSPIIWTSIATGKGAAKHGIKGFWHAAPKGVAGRSAAEQAQIDHLRGLGYLGAGSDEGHDVMYAQHERRAKAVWTILSEQGLTCDILGWWVTYPTETINGRMISDRYLYNRFALKAESDTQLVYDRTEEQVYPPEFESRIRPLVKRVDDVTAAEMQQFIRGQVALSQQMKLHAVEDELRVVYAKDESLVNMAKMMLAEGMPDLFTLYIQGTDVTSHYFWKHRFPDQWKARYPAEAVPAAEQRRYGHTIEEYYKLQDRHVGELLEFVDESVTVIVCSDHGFVLGKRPASVAGPAETVSAVHGPFAPPGLFIISGSGVKKGVKLTDAHVHDIAPTVLTLLGLPVGADMDGKVLTQALDPQAFPSGLEARYVRTYEATGN
ncbi:MAG: alkaline phosphatase family protein [Planctomycetota bacterium]